MSNEASNDSQPDFMEILQAKYPDMKPVSSSPGLGSLNGFGLGMFGRRQVCHETGTYVKTHAISALFIPILALRAYRVADAAEGGWYFLGRVPLSTFAKAWNILMFLACFSLVGSFAYSTYTSSPEYIANRYLKEAAQHESSGAFLPAARSYHTVLEESSAKRSEASSGLSRVLLAALEQADMTTQMEALEFIGNLSDDYHDPPVVPDIVPRVLEITKQHESDDPKWCVQALETITPLEPENEALTSRMRELLEAIVTEAPDDAVYCEKLAILHEGEGELEQAFALLDPVSDKLGSGEGARILGQLLVQRGSYDRAYSLLNAYVNPRVDGLRSAASRYDRVYEQIYERWLAHLESGEAGDSFYRKLESATEEEQATMVQEFIFSRMEKDRRYKEALQNLRDANAVVPVVIDLGIVQLNRARSTSDPKERQVELEAAENTFLSIQNVAGDTDDYQLTLGQVYHWLGKQEEANQQFDQLLKKNSRSPMVLFALANTMRDLGDESRTRELLDEAYEKATEDQEKYAIASLRAISAKDTDDSLDWWSKADPNDPHVQTQIVSYKGHKAAEDGDDEAAVRYFREAVKSYDAHPESTSTLNNKGLVHLRLFDMTGDPAEHRRGAELLAEAVKLEPGDSVLLYNSATTGISTAFIEEFGGSLDLKSLSRDVGIGLIRHLYDDEASRSAAIEKLAANERFQAAMAQLEQVMVLAPKSARGYGSALGVYGTIRNAVQLESLAKRISDADLDLSEVIAASKEAYQSEPTQDDLQLAGKQVDHYRKVSGEAADGGQELTAAILGAQLCSTLQAYSALGGEVDPSEVLRIAEASGAKHPSSASRSANLSANFFAGITEVAANHPGIRAAWNRCRQHFAAYQFASALLEQGGAPADALKKNPRIMRGITLSNEQNKRYPNSSSIVDWAMLKNIDPGLAATALENQSEVSKLRGTVEGQLSPMSGSVLLNRYWRLKASGNPEKALEVKQNAIEQGVPWPEA